MKNIMKKFVLILCIIMLPAMLCVGAAAFTDIEDETTEHAVATLESMGIVTGTSATKYSPSLALTRAQVCTMIIRTMGLESSVTSYMYQSLFRDVKNTMWHAGYVNLAYGQGIINGYGNGYFGPDDDITYGQFVTIVLRLLGYTEKDIGRIWPTDYIVFAGDLGIDENVSLSANDPVTRGDAAVLLYNALMAKAKGTNTEYYRLVGGYASSVTAILLDNHVSGTTTGDLYACVIENTGVTMKYYYQKNAVSDVFVGSLGSLLLNSAGEVIGFVTDGSDCTDLIVASAKISGITDTAGNTYKIGSTVSVLSAGSIYPYGSTGYLKVNAHANQSARFYYNDDGTIAYIYLETGTDPSKTAIAIASSATPAAEFRKQLDITAAQYHIVKNNGQADTAALAQYDVAYYDSMTNTLHVSDHKITGYIDSASPSIHAPETITISGCTVAVLQSAWDSLQACRHGDYVTVLLTDTNAVAAVYSAETVSETMYGILSRDGNSLTLCGSNLVMKPKDISANTLLNGSLVKINTADQDCVTCTSVHKAMSPTVSIDLENKTAGDLVIAPGCTIYEWSGSGYVYSLEGVHGESSTDFSEIYWTDRLSASYVDFYHVNNASMIDILLLSDVTGNYYQYGLLTLYKNEKGFAVGNTYINGITIANAEKPSGSEKYRCTIPSSSGYAGLALAADTAHTKVSAIERPTVSYGTKAEDFYLADDENWYVHIQGYAIPVSEAVQIHIKPADTWYSGEEGLLRALASELTMQVYYDRTLTTGAQVRMIVLDAE